MAQESIHPSEGSGPDDALKADAAAMPHREKQTERSTLQVFDQRGQMLEVDVATSRTRSRLAEGVWGEWETGPRALSLHGEPVEMLDEQTLEVVHTAQRLSVHPPLSGG